MQYYGLVILSLHIFIFYNFLVLSEARTECFLIVGILRCPAHPDKVKGVKIDLVDEDSLPLEIDDIMGRTWSTTNGSFTVSGCGSDFGPLNTPDPFLQIDHLCPHRRTGITQQVQVDVIPIFLPRTINLGSIYLDRYLEDEVV